MEGLRLYPQPPVLIRRALDTGQRPAFPGLPSLACLPLACLPLPLACTEEGGRATISDPGIGVKRIQPAGQHGHHVIRRALRLPPHVRAPLAGSQARRDPPARGCIQPLPS